MEAVIATPPASGVTWKKRAATVSAVTVLILFQLLLAWSELRTALPVIHGWLSKWHASVAVEVAEECERQHKAPQLMPDGSARCVELGK